MYIISWTILSIINASTLRVVALFIENTACITYIPSRSLSTFLGSDEGHLIVRVVGVQKRIVVIFVIGPGLVSTDLRGQRPYYRVTRFSYICDQALNRIW